MAKKLKHRHSLFMDLFVALLTWMTVRGPTDGYIFCEVVKTREICKINPDRPLNSSRFTTLLRDRVAHLGIGSQDCIMYTGHSLKVGAIQLYRALGLRDKYIMQKVQMSGSRAYDNYCAAYNDCCPADQPRFINAKDYMAHAKNIAGESEVLLDSDQFNSFMKEILGQDSIPDYLSAN